MRGLKMRVRFNPTLKFSTLLQIFAGRTEKYEVHVRNNATDTHSGPFGLKKQLGLRAFNSTSKLNFRFKK